MGYVRLPKEMYQRALENFKRGVSGSQFLNADGEKISGPLTQVYR